MPPKFVENGKPRKHPLEDLFKAPAWASSRPLSMGTGHGQM